MTKTLGITFLTGCTIILRCLHCPEQAPVVLAPPGNKVELYAYLWIIDQAKFPELVGDVFGCIGRCTITSYKNLVTCVITLFGLRILFPKWQYPAARGLPCFWLLQ